MSEKVKLVDSYAMKSDTGRVRLNNQDRVAIIKNKSGDILLIVADGLGGHNKGDYASKLAVDFISESFRKIKGFVSVFVAKYRIQHIINSANRLIFNYGEKSPTYEGMGTTLVMVLVHKNSIVTFNVGDSRAYIYLNKKLKLLSEDQSYVDYLKRSGQLSEEEASNRKDKNVLMNALGVYPSTNTNVSISTYAGDPLLLCSDGLFNNLSEDEIIEIITKDISAEEKVNALVYKANANGGSDNISAVYFARSKS